MSKVLFIISYEVKDDSKAEFLAKINKIKIQMNELGKNYQVFEEKGKNKFHEIFFCKSMDDYDSLDENIPDETKNLIDSLKSHIKGEMNYQTLIQLE